MSIYFCAISPTKYLDLVKKRPVHLLLAHLVEEDHEYREFYANLRKENPGVVYIGDNSGYEFYRRGEDMYPAEKLIDVYSRVGVDYIVASDYPGHPGAKTIEAAIDLIPKFKAAGIKTFFCPQSQVGDLDDYLDCMQWAIDNPDIGMIGLSILGVPNAFGIRQTTYQEDGKADEMYRLQRFLSRWRLLTLMNNFGMLSEKTHKRFHMLGLLDGPRELELVQPFADHIFSNDSSSPIWHALHGIQYDASPTGLINGKLESEVEFGIQSELTPQDVELIRYNINIIDRFCE
jgi:hypothetical protein